MRVQAFFSKNRRFLPFTVTLAAILAVGLGILLVSFASANGPSTPLNPLGYLDFTYATTISPTLPPAHMTGEKPESKLWWNDGFWWGSLYQPNENDPQAGEYHIFRLNWGNLAASRPWSRSTGSLGVEHCGVGTDAEETVRWNENRGTPCGAGPCNQYGSIHRCFVAEAGT